MRTSRGGFMLGLLGAALLAAAGCTAGDDNPTQITGVSGETAGGSNVRDQADYYREMQQRNTQALGKSGYPGAQNPPPGAGTP